MSILLNSVVNHEPQRIHRRRCRPRMVRGAGLSDRSRAAPRARRTGFGTGFIWRGGVGGELARGNLAAKLRYFFPHHRNPARNAATEAASWGPERQPFG